MKFSQAALFRMAIVIAFTAALVYSFIDGERTFDVEIEDYRAVAKRVGDAWSGCWMVEWGPADEPEPPQGESQQGRDHKHQMFMTCN